MDFARMMRLLFMSGMKQDEQGNFYGDATQLDRFRINLEDDQRSNAEYDKFMNMDNTRNNDWGSF